MLVRLEGTVKSVKDHLVRLSKSRGRLISVILPVFNESNILPRVLSELYSYLASAPGYKYEITFIDDGSTDGSMDTILASTSEAPVNCRVSVCRIARNSGGHIAITAGLNMARGDFTIVMASDGQDPPEMIGNLIQQWAEGNDIVLAARSRNLDQNKFSQWLSSVGWLLMSWLTQIQAPAKGCDLLGLDRIALDAFNRMDERNTTFIFRILSLGFRRSEIVYEKRRRFGGKSSWNNKKKILIMLDAITGYSSRPLKILTGVGMVVFFMTVIRWILVVVDIYWHGNMVSDTEVILNSIFTSLSVTILLLGAIGDYIWRILEETRKRPLYEIQEAKGRVFEDFDRIR